MPKARFETWSLLCRASRNLHELDHLVEVVALDTSKSREAGLKSKPPRTFMDGACSDPMCII